MISLTSSEEKRVTGAGSPLAYDIREAKTTAELIERGPSSRLAFGTADVSKAAARENTLGAQLTTHRWPVISANRRTRLLVLKRRLRLPGARAANLAEQEFSRRFACIMRGRGRNSRWEKRREGGREDLLLDCSPLIRPRRGPILEGKRIDRQGARTAKPRRKPTTGVCLSYVGYADAFKFHLKGH